jgi:hypothetical protein
LNISRDSARQIFGSVRDFCLWSGKCWGAARFEIINLVEIEQTLRSLSYFDVLGRIRLTLAMSKGFLKIPLLITEIVLDVDPVINEQHQRKRAREEEEAREEPTSPSDSHFSFDSATTSSSSFAFDSDEAQSPPDTFTGNGPFDALGEEGRRKLSFEDGIGGRGLKDDTVFCRLCIRMITVLEGCEVVLGVVPP